MGPMLTVVDVLAVPVVRSAAPVLLTPASTGLRLVRWVHTSEIYEIGPLLQGQELLLTTGLGLVGQSPERLRRYVDSLADKGVAGVCLELGRTFDHVPPALVERASERDIAVVAFHAVVPFVAMTEAVHELLLDSEVASLRAGERLTDSLLRAMSDGVGLDGLLAEIASVVGAPVRLTDTAGGMVAESAGAPPDLPAAADIVVAGRVWGRLCCEATTESGRVALLRAVGILAVVVGRADATIGSRAIARRVLARALTGPGPVDEAAVARAAGRVGLSPGSGRVLVPLAVEVSSVDLAAAVAPVEDAARREFGAAVAGDIPGAVLVVVPVPLGAARSGAALGSRLLAAVDRPLSRRGAGAVRGVVVGEPAADLVAVRDRVAEVRATVALVGQVRVPGEAGFVLLTREVALERLLVSALGSPELSAFVDSQLGAVMEYDARRRRGLLPTVEAYLGTGGNKLATAAALGVQRQTLYDRLARLESLLGLDLDSPVARTALHVAVIAWRLRGGAAGFAPAHR